MSDPDQQPGDAVAPQPGDQFQYYQGGKKAFLRRMVLMDWNILGLVLLLAAMWYAGTAILLIFASLLFAIFLSALSRFVQRHLKLPGWASLALVLLLMVGIIGLGAYLMAPRIADEANQLSKAIPSAVADLRNRLNQYPLWRALVENIPSEKQTLDYFTSVMPKASLFFSSLVGMLGSFVIVVFVGIYFAAQPGLYLNGLVLLVPHAKRERAREVLDELGRTLGQWLIGKAMSMLVVGILTALGLSLLGVPLALILGIIAGLFDFIPYLGPLIAGVPAVLIAFSSSSTLAVYTIALFIAIQTFEGYVLLPLVERRMVSLPPALMIVMQVLFGTLFGLIGVALATPITAVLMVLVTMLYIQDVLGDKVRTPSQHHKH